MKKPLVITCLLLGCTTELPPPPPATPTDPCHGTQWLDGRELNCGPGKLYCTAKVVQQSESSCHIWCKDEYWPAEWVLPPEDPNHQTYIKVHDKYSGHEPMLCLVHQ